MSAALLFESTVWASRPKARTVADEQKKRRRAAGRSDRCRCAWVQVALHRPYRRLAATYVPRLEINLVSTPTGPRSPNGFEGRGHAAIWATFEAWLRPPPAISCRFWMLESNLLR